MATTVSSALVIAPDVQDINDQPVFNILDQDGKKLFDYTLEKQMCEPGSRREFIRSPNQNDMAFGYLCQGEGGRNTTLGLYRFTLEDEKDKKMKRIAITEMWSIDLEKAGVELGTEGVRSAVLTRSVSVRPRFVIATTDKIVSVAVRDGKVEF